VQSVLFLLIFVFENNVFSGKFGKITKCWEFVSSIPLIFSLFKLIWRISSAISKACGVFSSKQKIWINKK